MNVQFRPESSASTSIKTAIADCDIHPARATNDELFPFMAKRWHSHLETYGKQAYHGMMEGPPYPKAQPNASRRDAWLPPGTRKFLDIDGRPIAIFNIKGEFFGLLNRCPHQGAALCEGPLIGLAQSSNPGEIEYTKLGEIIRCPWHGWEFDIRTGQSYCDPKRFRVRAYPVNVEPGTAVVKGPYVAETIAVSVESDYVVVDL